MISSAGARSDWPRARPTTTGAAMPDGDREHRDQGEPQPEPDQPETARTGEERLLTRVIVVDERGSCSGSDASEHGYTCLDRLVDEHRGTPGARTNGGRGSPEGHPDDRPRVLPGPLVRSRHEHTAHDRRQDLDRPRRHPGPRFPGRPGRGPAPRPRGDQPAGLHRAPRARPQGAPSGPDGGDRGPLHPDDPARPADAGPAGRRADQPARGELRRVRHPAPRHRFAQPGHRPRHRARNWASPSRA